MANRFLNNITINDQYSLPSSDGTDGQVLSTTGAADGTTELVFVDQSTISSGSSEKVVVYAKNTSGASISKGTPVYITGTVGATDTVQIAPADAGNSAKMPAVGLLDDTLADNAFGYVITGGFMNNITTDPIDGTTPTSNDTVYVKNGGGLTLDKPTEGGLIQNIAKVGKVSGGNAGSLVVSSILRTNDVPNLTQGKVWVGSTGNTIESATIHLNESNNRLGINNTIPAQALDVVGQIQVTDSGTQTRLNLNNTATTGDSQINFQLSGSSKFTIGVDDSDSDKFKISGSNALGSSDRIVVDSTGNVGIGTTSPEEKLHVAGTTKSSTFKTGAGSIVITGQEIYANDEYTGNDGAIRLNRFGYQGGQTRFRDVDIYDGKGTFVMKVDGSSGNVGIGTTDPLGKLEISSSNVIGSVNGGADELVIQNNGYSGISILSNNANAGQILFGDNDSNVRGQLQYWHSDDSMRFGTSALERMRINSAGNVGIGTTSPQDLLHLSADSPVLRLTNTVDSGQSSIEFWDNQSGTNQHGEVFYDDNSNLFGLQGNANGIVFKASNTFPGSELMRLNGSGNLGIGTTSPARSLHVKKSGDNEVARFESDQTTSYIELEDANTTGQILIGTQGDNFKIHTAGTERFRIDGSGNVGIGTTSPTQKLHVAGSIRVTGAYYDSNNSAGTSGQVLSSTATGTDWVSLSEISGVDGTGTANYVAKWSDTDTITNSVIYDDGTNVGIGTVSPNYELTVGGGSINSIQILSSSTGSGATDGLRFWNTGNSTAMYSYDNTPMLFATNNSERLRITSDGNVGIGTTSPDRSLVVNHATDTRVKLQVNGTDTAQIQTLSNEARYHAIGASTPLGLWTNGAERMRIDASGNVGIGTITPSQKLEVSDSSAPTIRIDNTKNSTWTVGEELGKLEWYGNDASGEGPGVKGYIKLDSDNIYGAGFDMRFGTTDGTNGITERMVITKAGSVGVGVTAPVAKLHIGNGDGGSLFYINGQYNDVAFNGSTSGTNGVWSFINSATWDQTRFYVQDANNFDSRLTFRFTGNNGANEILSGTSTGKVGIGTNAPAERLEVTGNIQATGSRTISAQYDSNHYMRLEANSSGGVLKGLDGGVTTTFVRSYGDSYFNGGNFGIGTTNPGSKLQIGDTATTSNVAVRAISQQAYQAGFEAYGSGQGTGYMYVGQSLTYGGGVAYNGDGTPAAFDSGTTGADKITFFRRENSTDTAVMWYGYNSNDVNFRGDVIAYATSDEDLKDNINLIPNSIEKIKALRGVTFEWNEKSNKEIGKKEIGVIAQDVEKVLPEIVKTRDNGYKAVDYQKLTAVLIEAVKDQQEQIDELKNQLDAFTK